MAIFYSGSGHDQTSNDVLSEQPEVSAEERERLGYMGSGGIGAHYSQEANPEWDPQGGGEAVANGWKVGGTSAYDQDVNRARKMGAASFGRGAPRLNQADANEARGIQMGSLGLLREQATGAAPSAAATLSQRANQVAAQQAGAAGMHGGIGSSLSAQNAASTGASNQALAANAANAGQRAAEISHGQAALAAGAVGTQQQDIGAATSDAQLQAQQNALNEARQQAFERQGWGVRRTQQQAADDFARMRAAEQNEAERQRQFQAAMEDQKTMGAVNTALTVGSGAAGWSDPRTKMHIGSLGSLMRGRS